MSPRIQEINFLRVFFMFMIFAHHFNYEYWGGDCAVAAFFIISGFCMTLGYGEKVMKEDFSWKLFMKKRCIKLYPVHWFAFLIVWAGYGCHIPNNLWNAAKICFNAALVQSWIPLRGIYLSYNAPSWYLCDILFFAAVFPFLYRLICRLSRKATVVISCVILYIHING